MKMFFGLFTLPETNSSHLNIDDWNTLSFPFGAFRPIFRGENAVSFRECIPWDHSGHPQNLSISLAKTQVDSESKMPVVLQPMLG